VNINHYSVSVQLGESSDQRSYARMRWRGPESNALDQVQNGSFSPVVYIVLTASENAKAVGAHNGGQGDLCKRVLNK